MTDSTVAAAALAPAGRIARVVCVLLIDHGRLCRTRKFEPDYHYTDEFVDPSPFDEVVMINVTRGSGDPLAHGYWAAVERLLPKLQVPLTLGGGLNSLSDCERAFDAGADRVLLGRALYTHPGLASAISRTYGRQALVAGIDLIAGPSGHRLAPWLSPNQHDDPDPGHGYHRLYEQGVGEFLITSVDRDGSLSGYDLTMPTPRTHDLPVPFLLAGGAGNWQHLVQGITHAGAAGVCTSNIYHLTSQSIRAAKDHLDSQGVNIREP